MLSDNTLHIQEQFNFATAVKNFLLGFFALVSSSRDAGKNFKTFIYIPLQRGKMKQKSIISGQLYELSFFEGVVWVAMSSFFVSQPAITCLK